MKDSVSSLGIDLSYEFSDVLNGRSIEVKMVGKLFLVVV
jgi:hypothetical protein